MRSLGGSIVCLAGMIGMTGGGLADDGRVRWFLMAVGGVVATYGFVVWFYTRPYPEDGDREP